MATTGVPGAAATNATAANATMGLNVLLHGDGGQSFFDFPNQAVQQNLMGVVALAPNQDLFWGGGSGLNRTDGAAHSAAVNSLIQDVWLSTRMTFHHFSEKQVLPKNTDRPLRSSPKPSLSTKPTSSSPASLAAPSPFPASLCPNS